MPKSRIVSTMTWEEAPDTVDHLMVAKILGCSPITASKYFNEKDFPRLDKIGLKADKEAARLYFQGIKIMNNPKLQIDYLLLQEMKKMNKNFEIYFNEKEEKRSVSFAG